MATSGSYDFVLTRDDIINVALRRINELGTGESASATRVTECALVLNMIMKEWQADGMQLWRKQLISVSPLTAGTNGYNIGIGQTINTTPPLRIIQAYYHDNTSGADTPILVKTLDEYLTYSNKTTAGTPTQLYYTPPGAGISSTVGSISFFNPPDATFVATKSVVVVGVYPAADFDASTDNPDCPSFYYNALAWALAEALSYESGLPLAERSMISKMAEQTKERALSLDQEEGSLYFSPARYG